MAVTINGSGQVPVQVKQTVKNDLFTTTSSVPVDITGFSASITPTSSSNKILVMVNVLIGGSRDTYPYILLLRNGTSVGTGTGATGNQINTFGGAYLTNAVTATYMANYVSVNWLDSPSTTSSVTYKLQVASPYNGGYGTGIYINRQEDNSNVSPIQYGQSSITLMEISG